MSEHSDLTRWNRAGLNQFRYIDGNAIEYLELLRQQLVKQFDNSNEGKAQWIIPAEDTPANETVDENETLVKQQQRLSIRQKRITEMYHQDRRDWAWEITRTFARSCHMLTEHSNAYANEGYLGTATQWEHVRRLVDMLDYQPAPPASASTYLVLEAKNGKSGIIGKGLQVKYTPENGGEKVVFETLEDVFIDSALNMLRPKNWNKSEEPAVPLSPPNNSVDPYPVIANQSISIIEGIGKKYTKLLSKKTKIKNIKVKDFATLEPDKLKVSAKFKAMIWEWKAKADVLLTFNPVGDWFALIKEQPELTLLEITKVKAKTLAAQSGNTIESASEVKLEIEIVELCLVNKVFSKTKFSDLFVLDSASNDSIATPWLAQAKPDISPNEVAMVYREYNDNAGNIIDEAEAATIKRIEKRTDIIHLNLSAKQQSWLKWSKNEAHLLVAPKWERKCGLNGTDVVRTVEPHGFSKGAYVSWKVDSAWKFAEVIEVDKQSMRLRTNDSVMPNKDTSLYEAIPITTSTMASNLDAIGMVAGDLPDIKDIGFGESVGDETEVIEKPFTIAPPDYSSPPDILAPPGGLSIGSFLFPTPMLPLDLVKLAVDLMLSMGVMVIPSTGEIVFKEILDINTEMPSADELYEMLAVLPTIEWQAGTRDELIEKLQQMLDSLPEPLDIEPEVKFKEILTEIEKVNPLIAVSQLAEIKSVVSEFKPQYLFQGSPDKIAKGDWVVGEFADYVKALKIDSIKEYEGGDKAKTFSIVFYNMKAADKNLKKIYANFKGDLIATGSNINNKELDSDAVELENIPDTLKVGKSVVLHCDDDKPVAARVEKVEGNKITFTPSVRGYRKGCLVVSGNIVNASHGVSKPSKIVGSGDASKSNQEFILEIDNLSFISDATMRSGVAAAIEVEVAGRVWEQVPTLMDSTPGDHHYAIRMTEQSYAKIIFGDGENGRRLPSGKNNIRVRYRVGSGIAGNVSAGSLKKQVNPHPLIELVSQPVAAAGGGDMEDVTSLRENAPPTLLSLERAVSLSDFSHLATSQSSIWQAKAYQQIIHGGKTEIVRVVIVPAGGVESIQANKTLTEFLQKHAMPSIQVVVDSFNKVTFSLSITLRIITDAFVAIDVAKDVETALINNFTLKNRKLGEHLYLSEVYKIVEGVQGVENSICVLNNKDRLQVVKADDDSTVLCLDTDDSSSPSELVINVEEYLP